MNDQKLSFLTTLFVPLVEKINPTQQPLWGKMNAQQMVEHIAEFFQVSTEKKHFPLVTPEEHLPKFMEFLMSEKQFRENTKAPVLPEDPKSIIYTTFGDAVKFLKIEVENFASFFKDEPHKKTLHPVFGYLNFEEWVQLHHKHVTHHLKQFGVDLKMEE